MVKRTWYIVALTLVSIAAAFLLPAMPQPAAYHDFADRRTGFGIENVLDVVSNAGFLLAGIAGLVVVLRPRTRFEFAAERWPYGLFFLGVLLTGAGSAYYHLAPDNERLFWDEDNLQSLCAPCHSGTKQIIDGVGYSQAAGVDGLPLDPNHRWNKDK